MIKTQLFFRACLASALLLSSAIASAQFYKWVDEDGRVHYSDQKPAQANEVSEAKVHIGKGTPNKNQAGARSATQNEQAADTPSKEDQLNNKAEKLSQNKSTGDKGKLCASAQENLDKISLNPRLRINDGGEMRFLTPEEIEDRKATYTNYLKENC